jgi:predicted DCC family thiol-disulfide oxidoreductase YuxK
MSMPPFSYRENPAVPAFDDSRPVFIFDHVCVLCSGGVSFIMKHDRKGAIAFTPAQGPLGLALCDHFGIDWDESYVFIRNGRAHIKSTGFFEVARALGGWWRLGLIFQIIPRLDHVLTASSLMILDFDEKKIGSDGSLFLADCGVIPEPTAEQLCDIALSTATIAQHLTNEVPRVAMLSYATKSPSAHPARLKVRRATELARAKAAMA